MERILSTGALQERLKQAGILVPLPGQPGGCPRPDKRAAFDPGNKDTGSKCVATSAPGFFVTDEARLAPPRDRNAAEFYVTGAAYFKAVAQAMRQAKEFIWIAGWQLAWDVELEDFGSGKSRLIDIIKAVDPKKIEVRVMMFGTRFSVPPIDDVHVAEVLKSLGCTVVRATGESDFSEVMYSYYSHHQKCVIVDGKKAFIGGIDLTHGRRDDHTFPVVVDPAIRRINEMYNACVPKTRALNSDEKNLIKVGQAVGGAREPYDNTDHLVLDHQHRPRQPWQDVALKIEGPSVFDLVSNYVRRWNGLMDLPDPDRSLPSVDRAIKMVGSRGLEEYLPDQIVAEGAPTATVQVLRSASQDQNRREWLHGNLGSARLPQAYKSNTGKRVQVDIQEAMIRAIQGAQQFIYLEYQYFLSHYGKEQVVDANGVPIDAPPLSEEVKHAADLFAKDKGSGSAWLFYKTQTHQAKEVNNLVVSALGERIAQAIRQDQPFHVYLMMPLHSEGMLNDPMIMGVMHHTMQTLTFGSHSLINLIKRALLEKSLEKDGRRISDIQPDDLPGQLWAIPEADWSKYLTVLYARNFGVIPGGPLVTEQIYVHTKSMVVDDNVAIIGSANLNDRSLMGGRDTELAALVIDSTTVAATLDGKKPAMVRKFARELRQSLWRKHLGLAGPLPAGGVVRADLPESVLNEPASLQTARAIQRLAKANSEVYEGVFPWVPRNQDERRKTDDPAKKMASSIWPGWTTEGDDSSQPWSSEFSDPGASDHSQASGKVKGFWCSYPYLWMQGQNNYDPRIALEFLTQVEQTETRITLNDEKDTSRAAG